MAKSKHDYNGCEISYSELGNFIEPIKCNINIPFTDLEHLLTNGCRKEVTDALYDIHLNMIMCMPTLVKRLEEFNYTELDLLTSITYNSHTNGYDFRINPIDFVNTLYSFLRLDYRIPFINLDNEFGPEYFKDYVRSYTNDAKRVIANTNPRALAILEELNRNMDTIIGFYYVNINRYIKKSVIPKDILLYIAWKSLLAFRSTGDYSYSVIPYEYFNYVSDMSNTPYPHKVQINFQRRWFDDFRGYYKIYLKEDYVPNVDDYKLVDNEILVAWDILKPGMIERELRDTYQRQRASANVNYEKYKELFERKLNYYLKSPYLKYIAGKYGLLGYVGFSYPNEYLIFDKFHNSETKNENKKTILTHGEAIYALPSDRFSVVCQNKQKVIAEKEIDPRIKKLNHTPNYSFIGKLDDIITGPNVSTSTFDQEVEKQMKRVLINNKS